MLFEKIKLFFERKPLTLTWAIAALVCLVMVFSYYGFFRPSLVGIGHRTTTYHLENARNAADRITGFINDNQSALNQLAEVLAVIPESGRRESVIKFFMKERKWFNEIDMVDRFGRETVKVSQYNVFGPDDFLSVADYDYFETAIAGQEYIGPVQTSDKAIPYLAMALPIRETANNTIGVIAAELSLRKVWEIVADFEVGENGQVYVVDELGFLIAHRDTSLVLNKTSVVGRKIVSRVITEKRAVLGLAADEEYTNENNKRAYAVGLPLADLGWGVFVEEPAAEAWASYQKIRATGIILGFVTLVLLLILIINARVLNMLFVDLRKGRSLLASEVEKRTAELLELDRTTKLLVRRDLELSTTNRELDKKIEQLEKSEKSLLRAFGDIRHAQKELEEEKDKTEAVINNFIDPIIVLDEDWRIILFNPAAQRIFNFGPDVLGRTVPHENDFSFNNFKAVAKTGFSAKKLEDIEAGGTMLEEVEIKQGDHIATYKVLTAKVINDRGDYQGVMKIFYDVTREKTLDKLKSEFISIAAHQLRTPLSAIKWVMKMILDEDVGKLNREQRELMDKGYKSNERIIRLVNDLLNVSRIEEGRFGYTFEKNDFSEIINAVVEGVAGLIAKNHVKFSVNKPKNMEAVVFDKEKMLLVMQNLVDNAVKYTPEYGKIEINVSREGKFFRVAVKDNGVGIPAGDQAKLFSKFFRATNVIRMQTEGSGLGLFIVKNIIEKHGGTMAVSSREGEGTEVSFKIPIVT